MWEQWENHRSSVRVKTVGRTQVLYCAKIVSEHQKFGALSACKIRSSNCWNTEWKHQKFSVFNSKEKSKVLYCAKTVSENQRFYAIFQLFPHINQHISNLFKHQIRRIKAQQFIEVLILNLSLTLIKKFWSTVFLFMQWYRQH